MDVLSPIEIALLSIFGFGGIWAGHYSFGKAMRSRATSTGLLWILPFMACCVVSAYCLLILMVAAS